METGTEKMDAYQQVKKSLDEAFEKGGIPNVKKFKEVIADLKKRIRLLESGTPFFATSVDDVEKASVQIARLSGQLEAYQERYKWIQERLRANN